MPAKQFHIVLCEAYLGRSNLCVKAKITHIKYPLDKKKFMLIQRCVFYRSLSCLNPAIFNTLLRSFFDSQIRVYVNPLSCFIYHIETACRNMLV